MVCGWIPDAANNYGAGASVATGGRPLLFLSVVAALSIPFFVLARRCRKQGKVDSGLHVIRGSSWRMAFPHEVGATVKILVVSRNSPSRTPRLAGSTVRFRTEATRFR